VVHGEYVISGQKDYVIVLIGFERWKNPLYVVAMDNPDGYGRITGSGGDTMQILLNLKITKSKRPHF
jgi:hypothetical protein